MDIQSLYQRWYDDNVNKPMYVAIPALLSYDNFTSCMLGDADILYDYGYDVATLTADNLSDIDDFDSGIFTAAEIVYIWQQLLSTSTPA